LNVVMMGPPGAGKGTQAGLLAERFGLVHLAPGDLLRQAVKEDTALGRRAKEYMDAGRLVPDDLIIELIGSRLREAVAHRAPGVVLDGFPRTLRQAEALTGLLEKAGGLDAVLNLCLPEDEAVARLTGRRVCRKCGANYHLVYKPPDSPDTCDRCGGPLYQRSDDTEATARARLEVYRCETEPLVTYYAEKGLLRDVDGRGSVGEVTERLASALGLDG
jgi:adenylate kinase